MEKLIKTWKHRITVHNAEEILDNVHVKLDHVPSAVYCDEEGGCYFDEDADYFVKAIEKILDKIGGEGWELVNVSLRPNQMICFWKKAS